MLDINHILVVLDKNDEEQPGLQRACWLAKALDADLTLLTTAWDSFGDQASQLADTTANSVKQALLRQAQLWLDSLTELDSCSGIKTNTEAH